jgi:alpha-tubulin suppressor-like RCC1 family protein
VAVARLVLGGQVGTLDVGQTHRVSASPQDANGRMLTDRTVRWESSNPSVATVGQDGTIEARTQGRVTITASVEGQTQQFVLEVTAPPVLAIDTPAAPPGPPTAATVTAAALGLGTEFSCATLSDGSATCWGAGAPAVASTSGLQTVVSGTDHVCGLRGTGVAVCWGANASGQLGNGEASRDRVTQPAPVATDLRFGSLVAGAAHTCGIARDGAAWCWGENNDAQLGNNSTRDSPVPVAVERGLTFQTLAAGEKHTCGVTTDGKVFCWGDGFANQLGIGITEQRRTPDEARMRETATTIAAGRNSTCAVGTEGNTYCWGSGSGFGSTPRRVETDQQFTQLAVGDEFACGLTRAGAAWCWGEGSRGQLGDGAGRDSRSPVKVATSEPLTSIAAGNAHACAVTRAGPTVCWGQNAKQQVGTAGADPVLQPVPVEIRR